MVSVSQKETGQPGTATNFPISSERYFKHQATSITQSNRNQLGYPPKIIPTPTFLQGSAQTIGDTSRHRASVVPHPLHQLYSGHLPHLGRRTNSQLYPRPHLPHSQQCSLPRHPALWRRNLRKTSASSTLVTAPSSNGCDSSTPPSKKGWPHWTVAYNNSLCSSQPLHHGAYQ